MKTPYILTFLLCSMIWVGVAEAEKKKKKREKKGK